MSATDNSSVQITINVVDGNSGAVVGQVTKSLQSFGAAGAAAGQSVAAGLNQAGAAGVSAGNAIGAGMKAVGGHTLTSLDNVRLLRDDLGIRIPRAMEKVIAQSKLASGAIGAVGGALVGIGLLEVGTRLGLQIYDLYKRFIDTGHVVDDFNRKLGETAEKKFFDNASIEDVNANLVRTGQLLDSLDRKRKESVGVSGLLGSLAKDFAQGGPGGGGAGNLVSTYANRFFNSSDAALRNQSQERNDEDRRRGAEEVHKQNLDAIRDERERAAALKGSAAAQAEYNAKVREAAENRRYLVQRSQIEADVANRAKKPYEPKVAVAPDAGASAERAEVGVADAARYAKSVELARTSREETLRIEAEARATNLRGEAVYAAQRDEQLRVLAQRLRETELSPIDYARQVAAVQEKYAGERLKRLDQERAETERLRLEANTGGLTGVAKVDAQRDTRLAALDKEAPGFSDPNTKAQRETAIRQQSNAEATEEQQRFTERLSQLDEERGSRFESENQRLAAAGKRTTDEITKSWEELYGKLAAGDARRVQSYAALEGEITKINAQVVADQAESRRKLTLDTEKAERTGARGGGDPERERTQAILDEYADRYAHLEELRRNDADNADLYRRQEIAAEQEKNNKLLDQQRQLRDKLAGQLRGFFDHPLEELRRQAEEAAAKIAASFLLKAKGGPGATANGAPGNAGSGLAGVLGLPADLGGIGGIVGFGGRKPPHAHGGAGASPTTVSAPAATVATGSSTLNASSAVINVQAATINGLGGGAAGARSSSPFRNASYVTSGGGGGGISISGGGGDFSGGASTGGSGGGSFSSDDLGSSSLSGRVLGGTPLGGDSRGSGASGAGSPTFSDLPASISAPVPFTRAGISGGGAMLSSGEGGGPGARASIAGTLNTLPGMGQDINQLTKSLGVKGGIASKLPGVDDDSKLGQFLGSDKTKGVASGALGVFGAFESGGGFGGALQGALGGAKIGSELGGPLGGAIGAAAGALIGVVGFGGRKKAENYDKHQVKPHIDADYTAFESGGMDYQTAFDDLDALSRQAKMDLHKIGTAGTSYYNDTVKGEIKTAQDRLTRESKSGRAQFGFTAAQFHTGGLVSDFGSLATSPTEGFAHLEKGEVVMHQQASSSHATALQAMLGGASHSDIASLYGAQSTRAPAASTGGDVNMHFHSADAKAAMRLFMDNKHHIRAALNQSYAENSSGADFTNA